MSDPFEEANKALRELAEKRIARMPEFLKRVEDELERRGYEVRGKTIEEMEEIVARAPTKTKKPHP